MKIQMVLNTCYGGFRLSKRAIARLKELGMTYTLPRLTKETDDNFEYRNFTSKLEQDRTNPLLIQIIKELGPEASGECSDLKIVEYDYDPMDHITYHDGKESLENY